MSRVCTGRVMRRYVGRGHGLLDVYRTYFFVMVHSEGCFNLVPGILRGNKCVTTKVAAC